MGILRRTWKTIKKVFERQGPRITTKIGKTEWIDSGTWADVTSSWVAKIRYVLSSSTMYVKFKSGHVQPYHDVEKETALAIFHSGSIGSAIWTHFLHHKRRH